MRKEESDMWVWGQGHMGRSREGLGIVQVKWGCTGIAGEEVVCFGGNGGLVKIVATARRNVKQLLEVCTAIKEKKKKLPVKDRWQLH
uniref:Uncharacterized protein n=1 Tax=Tanacetum cinerariifolium TaxID=118510 RepID=A0A699JNW9_TANCI|nr:hypothetical protein [Tanacetum cinerariifolium]